MNRLGLPMLGALMITGSLQAQDPAVLTKPEVYVAPGGETLNYRRYLPPQTAAGRKLPLVLFLHGAGERGSNNVSQLLHGIQPLIEYGQAHSDPAVLLVPQCPIGMRWVDTPWNATNQVMSAEPSRTMKLVLTLLDEERVKPGIDPARIYVTGMSMGGYGTWDVIQRRPGLFAAAVPICGGGDANYVAALKRIPIWAFHGEKDAAVPVCRSRNMCQALRDCGGNVQYREYPGAGHNVWTRTYNDTDVLAWLFAQRLPAAPAG